jgi:hypothetical protein
VNFQFTPVGGCQQQVSDGDHVLWAFDAFNKVYFLKLTGPTNARLHHPITVTVVDGSTRTPVAGATVDGVTTGADGTASLTFTHRGAFRLKADKSDSLRSNELVVEVS